MILVLGVAWAGDIAWMQEISTGVAPRGLALGPEGVAVAGHFDTVWITDAASATSKNAAVSVAFADDMLWTCGEDGLARITAPGALPIGVSSQPCLQAVAGLDSVVVRDERGVLVGDDVLDADLLASGAGVAAAARRTDDVVYLLESFGTSQIYVGGPIDALGDGPDGPVVAVGGFAWTVGEIDAVAVPTDVVAIAAGYIDTDDRLDVVSMGPSGVGLSLGDGRFLVLSEDPMYIAVGDLQGDGCDEIALTVDGDVLVAGDTSCVDDFDLDGFSVAAGDCDDVDPSRFPGAEEICGNDLDDNCDGHVDPGYVGSITTVPKRPFEGEPFLVVVRPVGCLYAVQIGGVETDDLAPTRCEEPFDQRFTCTREVPGVATHRISGTDTAGAWSRTFDVEVENVNPSLLFPIENPAFGLTMDEDDVLEIAFVIEDPGDNPNTAEVFGASFATLAGDNLRLAPTEPGSFDLQLIALDGEGGEDSLRFRVDVADRGCTTASGTAGSALLALALLRRRRDRAR